MLEIKDNLSKMNEESSEVYQGCKPSTCDSLPLEQEDISQMSETDLKMYDRYKHNLEVMRRSSRWGVCGQMYK